jgi:hypothetical protein
MAEGLRWVVLSNALLICDTVRAMKPYQFFVTYPIPGNVSQAYHGSWSHLVIDELIRIVLFCIIGSMNCQTLRFCVQSPLLVLMKWPVYT